MSDKLLNKLNNVPEELVFSSKQLEMVERELMSEVDKRITDILHKIEFDSLTPNRALKLCAKLQAFLKKRRILKGKGKIYIPRTESGNYIINSKITTRKLKVGDEK